MTAAISNEIGAVFVPVSDIVAARDWYCRLLGLVPGEVLFGHLYLLPMRDGSGLALDSKGYAGPHDGKPIFHFNASDMPAARRHALSVGGGEVSDITDGVFFTLKDPDGNLLMVANVPPAPRSEANA